MLVTLLDRDNFVGRIRRAIQSALAEDQHADSCALAPDGTVVEPRAREQDHGFPRALSAW
jgi:hypothetical protein